MSLFTFAYVQGKREPSGAIPPVAHRRGTGSTAYEHFAVIGGKIDRDTKEVTFVQHGETGPRIHICQAVLKLIPICFSSLNNVIAPV
jgi:hypothetical protein